MSAGSPSSAIVAPFAAAHAHGRVSRPSAGVIASIGLLHVVGWGTLLTLGRGEHLRIGDATFGVGVGITAYLLGVRHAFDADHIAAIDNTTRKLLHEGGRPASVGFWFACGHSSIVIALSLLVALGSRLASEGLFDAGSRLHGVTRAIGPVVSGGFLYAIAALNLATLLGTRRGLDRRGPTSWLARPLKLVARPWQMALVGLLFGLGFDTASEIGLLVLTSSSSASSLPWQAVLSLPVLFAAGMSLFDTLDGCVMSAAYGWALDEPERKACYDLVVTGLSVAVALGVGTLELITALGGEPSAGSSIGSWLAALDPSRIGVAIVGLFVATWMVGIALGRDGLAVVARIAPVRASAHEGRVERPGVARRQRERHS